MSGFNEMEELHQTLLNCLDLLEESTGTCNDRQLLALMEESYTVIEKLCSTLESHYGQRD
jgi:hypothetical protein